MIEKTASSFRSPDMKKILIVSYAYPPSNTPGVFRIIGFINYFNDFGFDPIVITSKNPTAHVHDSELSEFIRCAAKVYKVWGFDLKDLATKLLGFIRAFKKRLSNGPPKHSTTDVSMRMEKPTSRIMRMLEFPDSRIGWTPFAFIRSIFVVRRSDIKYFLTSTPPHSLQIIGLLLKCIFPNRIWIADYRDPWTDNLAIRAELPSIFDRVERRIESACHKRADLIIANTWTNREKLLTANKGIEKSKVIVVTNGMDSKDFEALTPLYATDKAKLNCVFVGSLYKGMSKSISEALIWLHKHYPSEIDRIHFTFIGYSEESDKARFIESDINGNVTFVNSVSYKKSLQYMLGGDVLLYLLPPKEGMGHWIPSKLYNYMVSGRPILAIIPEGDAAEILRKSDRGVIIDPNKSDEICQFLINMKNEKSQGLIQSRMGTADIEQFERRNLVKQLADAILNLSIHSNA